MAVTLEGIFTDNNLELSKTPPGISVKLCGMTIDVMEVDRNASAPINVTFDKYLPLSV